MSVSSTLKIPFPRSPILSIFTCYLFCHGPFTAGRLRPVWYQTGPSCLVHVWSTLWPRSGTYVRATITCWLHSGARFTCGPNMSQTGCQTGWSCLKSTQDAACPQCFPWLLIVPALHLTSLSCPCTLLPTVNATQPTVLNHFLQCTFTNAPFITQSAVSLHFLSFLTFSFYFVLAVHICQQPGSELRQQSSGHWPKFSLCREVNQAMIQFHLRTLNSHCTVTVAFDGICKLEIFIWIWWLGGVVMMCSLPSFILCTS